MQDPAETAQGSDAELSRLVDRSLDLKLGLLDRRESRDLLIPPRLPAVTSIPFSGLHREGRIASKQLQQRCDTNITNFMGLVEASTHYPVREACLGGVPG
jgi:hypothetical protein